MSYLNKADEDIRKIFSQLNQAELDQYINSAKQYERIININFTDLMKRVKKSKASCMYLSCSDSTQQYCHLLQRNGILSNISHENHLMQPSIEDIFKWKSKELDITPLKIERVGISMAFTGKLFCNAHDTSIFKPIETDILDFHDYKTQILFTYRSVCNEIRILLDNLMVYGARVNEEMSRIYEFFMSENISSRVKMLHSDHINQFINRDRNNIRITERDISNLTFFKEELEREINSTSQNFDFVCIESEVLEIAASCVISSETFVHNGQVNHPFFLQIIPYNNKSYIIVGYHKQYSDDWLKNYLKRWSSYTKEEVQFECSRLLLTQCTTWCMSPKFYSELGGDGQAKLLEYHLRFYSNHGYRMSEEEWQSLKYNLFNKAE